MKTNKKELAEQYIFKEFNQKKKSNYIYIDDLAHPRFGIDTEVKNLNNTPNPLQFLMYSKENDTLFI
jgi:hypothetical protein